MKWIVWIKPVLLWKGLCYEIAWMHCCDNCSLFSAVKCTATVWNSICNGNAIGLNKSPHMRAFSWLNELCRYRRLRQLH